MNDHPTTERGLVAPASAEQNEQLDHSVRSANFTRHHYVWLAEAMRRILKDCSTWGNPKSTIKQAVEETIHMLSDELSDNNPNFNKKLFLDNIFASGKDQQNV